MALIVMRRICLQQLCQSYICGQKDSSVGGCQCCIPVELRRGKAIGIGIVGKHFRCRVKLRDSVCRCNPQMAILGFHNAFHGIVWQPIFHGIALHQHLSRFINDSLVKPVSIASHPNRAVTCLAERYDLLDNSTFRIVQFVLHGSYSECRGLRRRTGFQVYPP